MHNPKGYGPLTENNVYRGNIGPKRNVKWAFIPPEKNGRWRDPESSILKNKIENKY